MHKLHLPILLLDNLRTAVFHSSNTILLLDKLLLLLLLLVHLAHPLLLAKGANFRHRNSWLLFDCLKAW